jgi:O-antigen ligase
MSRATIGGDAFDEPDFTTPPLRPTPRPRRLVLWRAAARMFAAHPLAGVGPDNFRLAYGSYAGLVGADQRTHSNNMYLEMLAGGGLLVAAAFGWLLWRSAACAVAPLAMARRAGGASGTVAISGREGIPRHGHRLVAGNGR